jgi:hypothetical protein
VAGAGAVTGRAVVRRRVDEHRVVEQLHADAGGLPPALAHLWLSAPRECHLLDAHAAEGGADVDPRRARALCRRRFGCGAAAPAAASLEGARPRVLTRAVGGGWHQRGDRRRRFHGSRGSALFLLCDGGPTLPHSAPPPPTPTPTHSHKHKSSAGPFEPALRRGTPTLVYAHPLVHRSPPRSPTHPPHHPTHHNHHYYRRRRRRHPHTRAKHSNAPPRRAPPTSPLASPLASP